MDFFCTTFLTQLFHFVFSCCIVKDYSPKTQRSWTFFLQLPKTACFKVYFNFIFQ